MEWIVAVLLGICSYTDIKERVVSLKILACFLIISIGLMIALNGCAGITFKSVIFSVLPGLGMLAASRLLKEAIGTGDAYLLILTGFMIGTERNVILILCALMFSAVYAGILLILKRKNKYDSIPFVPFLFVSYILILIIKRGS